MSAQAPVVWIIKTGRTGTDNELKGVAQRLGAAQIIDIDIATPRQDRSAVNLAIEATNCSSLSDEERYSASGRKKLVQEITGLSKNPDIILATQSQFAHLVEGYRDLFPASFIAWFGGRGDRTSMRETGRANCFINYGDDRPGTIAPPGVGSLISPALLASVREKWQDTFASYPPPRTGVLIGGDVDRNSEKKAMLPADIQKLGHVLSRQLDEKGGSLLITTSRRTSPATRSALEKELSGRANVFWYHPASDKNTVSENPVHGIMAWADTLAVTSDSLSMVSEACATGRPVYIHPVTSEPGVNRLPLAKLTSGNHARFLGEGMDPGWQPTPIDITQIIADAIKERLRLRSQTPPR